VPWESAKLIKTSVFVFLANTIKVFSVKELQQ